MLEASFKEIANYFLIILLFEVLSAQHPQPSCVYFDKKVGKYSSNESHMEHANVKSHGACFVMKEQDNCIHYSRAGVSSYKFQVSEKFKLSLENEVNWVYVNVTLQTELSRLSDRFVLQEDEDTCWDVQVNEGEYPFEINIINLPLSSESSQLTAFPAGTGRGQGSCDSEKIQICHMLYNATLDFVAVPNGKYLKLKIKIDGSDVEETQYKLDLMSGPCTITCNSSENPCPVNIHYSEFNLSTGVGKEIGFVNLTPSHYCARIDSKDDCCHIYTDTIKLDEPGSKEVDVYLNLAFTFPAIAISIVIFSLIIFFFFKKEFLRIIRTLKSPKREPIEDFEPTLIQDSLVETFKDMKSTTQIYLVYPYERSNEYLDVMSSFRRLLRTFVRKVWDPFSEEDTENAVKNVPAWVDLVLEQPDLSVVLVETKRGSQRSSTQDDTLSQTHCLGNAFVYTLSRLRDIILSDPEFKSRIYVISLDSNFSGSLGIGNYTRYPMPDKFETLIYCLNRHERNSIDFQQFTRIKFSSAEIDNFNRSLELYKSKYSHFNLRKFASSLLTINTVN